MQKLEQIEKQTEKEVVEFEFKDLLPFGMSLVALTIGLAYGLSIQEDVRDDMTVGGYAYNATTEGIKATAKVPEKLGTIVTIVIAAIIIGILFRYFMVRYS